MTRNRSFIVNHFLASVTAIALLISCGTTTAERVGENRTTPVVLKTAPWSDADVESFHGIVTDLASPEMEGRGIGTKGLDKARNYLVARFRSFGLKPLYNEGDTDSYTQGFEAPAGVKVTKHSMVYSAKGQDNPAKQYTIMGFSPSKAFSGDAVFVGYSAVNDEAHYSSFGADKNALKGKIAIAFRYEPQDNKGKSLWAKKGGGRFGQWTGHSDLTRKAAHAADQGAVAFLFVNPPTQPTKTLKPTGQSIGRAIKIPALHISAKQFEQMLAASGVEDPAAKVKELQAGADSGKTGVTPIDGLTITGEVQLERPKVRVHNVAGVLPGAGKLKDEVIVIGAHYDHLGFGGSGSRSVGSKNIHPGADDNASGTAGLIKLAQHYAARVKPDWIVQGDQHIWLNKGKLIPDRRTLIFVAFTGEERGLLGSRYMVKNFKQANLEAKNIVAMMNMDMIGRLNKKKLYVMGVGSGKQWKQMVADASKDLDFDLKTTESGTGPSDHTSFYMEKIPVLHFFSGTHKDYHKTTDTADKINAEGAVKILTLFDRILMSLWVEPERIAYLKTKARPHMGGTPRGSGAYLGIVPDYATIEGDQGCGLDGVSPGGPAEKAGLKSGDLIVQWDKIKVGNVYDLMKGLNSSKPDQKVKLKVKRGDKVIDIEVTMGSR